MKGCISIWLQTSGSVVTAQASSSILVVKLATPTCLVLPSFLAWQSAAILVCNQIEMHPFINQDKVVAASKKHGMAVVAYCPIARGKVQGSQEFGADALERIGKAHNKSAAQVSLRYLVQMGVCAIPRTATPDHLKANLNVFDFKLSDTEMAELKKLNATNMRVVSPPHAPVWDVP